MMRALMVVVALAGCEIATDQHTKRLPAGTVCGGYKGDVKTCMLGRQAWVCTVKYGCVELARARP